MYFIKSDQSLRKHTLHLELDVYLYYILVYTKLNLQNSTKSTQAVGQNN